MVLLRPLLFTPLRISNAHGNVAFALKNSPQVGVLNVQRCREALLGQGGGFSQVLLKTCEPLYELRILAT